MTAQSVFASAEDRIWPYKYAVTLHVDELHGGVPSDPKVAYAWIKSRLTGSDELLREMVTNTIAERGISYDDAVSAVVSESKLCGFKQNELGLLVEGRQIKAALKEATNVCVAAEKIAKRGWGATSKGATGFVAEHVVVLEREVSLGLTRAEFDRFALDGSGRCGIDQRFVHAWKVDAIKYEEYVRDVDLNFTVVADWDFGETTWEAIWLTGEKQGIGASRSQGFGTYVVTRWDRISVSDAKRRKAA